MAVLDTIDVCVGRIESVLGINGSDKLVKLDPPKMCGVVSNGMLFHIGYADEIRPVLAMSDGVRAG